VTVASLVQIMRSTAAKIKCGSQGIFLHHCLRLLEHLYRITPLSGCLQVGCTFDDGLVTGLEPTLARVRPITDV
jgi:hypothetical protein